MLYFDSVEFRGLTIIRIYLDQVKNYQVGSVEIVFKKGYTYIENVFIQFEYRHKGYLTQVINYLKHFGKLVALPLPQHLDKFKHLGFTFFEKKGDDTYYVLG